MFAIIAAALGAGRSATISREHVSSGTTHCTKLSNHRSASPVSAPTLLDSRFQSDVVIFCRKFLIRN